MEYRKLTKEDITKNGFGIVGKIFHCRYWNKDYLVLENKEDTTVIQWLEDNRIVEHATRIDFKKDLIIYDLIYNKQTPFKQFAGKNKLKYISGLGMLVQQGAFGFQMWTGKKPNIKLATELIKK